MFNHPLALELAYTAVEEAVRLGASYADARFELRHSEDIATQNGELDHATVSEQRGLAVRALVRGAWGQVAVSEPGRHDVTVAARRAVDAARTSAILQLRRVQMAPPEPQRAAFRTAITRDPLAVPLEDKLELLVSIDDQLSLERAVVHTRARFQALRQRKILVSSEGSELDQELVRTGLGYQAGALGPDGDLRLRSFHGGPGGVVMSKGWEMVYELSPIQEAQRVAAEAVELSRAPPCPEGARTLVLSPHVMGSAVLHTLGPLVSEEADGATITPSTLSLTADATILGGAGSYGFDDDGVEARAVQLLDQGRRVGSLSAPGLGLERANGWEHAPARWPSNLALAPGGKSLEDLWAAAEGGLYLQGPRGVVVDPAGGRFSASAEVAWELKGGVRGQMYRHPQYSGGLSELWSSCVGLGDADSYALGGRFGLGMGQRSGVIIGYGAPAGSFESVRVGPQGGRGRRILPEPQLRQRGRRASRMESR